MSTSKIESVLQNNYSSCELPTTMLNDTFQHYSVNSTSSAASTATNTATALASMYSSDLNGLKLQFKTKEQAWSKDKAILEQKIELLESHIHESRIRQENLQKMNEAFMTALHDLTENPKNFSNKMLKDLQQLFDGKRGCEQHEQQLQKNSSTIKSQRIQLDELRARVTALEDELAEKQATHENDCENLRIFYQSEIQVLQNEHAVAIEEATNENGSADEITKLKNVIQAITANHKIEIESLQQSRTSQMKGELEADSRFQEEKLMQQQQLWQQQLHDHQQQFLLQQQQLQSQLQQQEQQQQQQMKLIDALQKEKTQLKGQFQSVATQLQASQEQNSIVAQALHNSQGQLEDLKLKLTAHTSPSFPNTCLDFFDAELQISRIEPDKAKSRSIVNDSLLSSLMPSSNTPNNTSNANNGQMFQPHNGSANQNLSQQFTNAASGKSLSQTPNANLNRTATAAENTVSNQKTNKDPALNQQQYCPPQKQEMHISELAATSKQNNNNNLGNNSLSASAGAELGLTRQGSVSGSEMSNCDTFGFPSAAQNSTNIRGQLNSAAHPNIPAGQNQQQQDSNDRTKLQQVQQQQKLSQQQQILLQQQQQQTMLSQQQQKLQQRMQSDQQLKQIGITQSQKQQQNARKGDNNSQQQGQISFSQPSQPHQNALVETSLENRSNTGLAQQSKRSAKASNGFDNVDSQGSIQNLKTEDTIKRRATNSANQHGQASLSCTNLQSLTSSTAPKHLNSNPANNNNNTNNNNNQDSSINQNQALHRNEGASHSSSNILNQQTYSSSSNNNNNNNNNNSINSGNISPFNSVHTKQPLRNSSCNPPKTGQENYPQPNSRQSNQFISTKSAYPKSCSSIGNMSYNNAGNALIPEPSGSSTIQSNNGFVLEAQLNQNDRDTSIHHNNNHNNSILSQSMASQSLVSQSMMMTTMGNNTNVSQSVSMGRANTNNNKNIQQIQSSTFPMSQSSLLNQDQSFLVRAINENMNERMSLEEKMRNLESEINNYVALAHPKTKSASSSSLPDQQLVQQVMKELYAKSLSRNIFQLAKEEREAALRVEIKILVDKVLQNKSLRQHSYDNHSSILNQSLNKSVLAAAEDSIHHGLRDSKSPRYNSTSASILHSTILSEKGSSSAALKPSSNIFGRILTKPSSATHFQQQLQGLQGQHFFDKKIRMPLGESISSANNRN